MFVPSLPAAATKRPGKLAIAVSRAALYAPPPHEAEIILAPFAVAYSTALIASVVDPPVAPRNLRDINLTFQLTPAIPTPLLPTAPIVPAT